MFSLFDLVVGILYSIPGIILSFIVHEFSHAKVADLLGDPTPRSQDKLSFKPSTHIDPLGLILIIFVGIGWAKPIETNRSYLKNPKRDSILISLAGPLANLLMAIFLCAILYYSHIDYVKSSIGGTGKISEFLTSFTVNAIKINMMFFIFNLLPIPPLDGFHVLENILPSGFYKPISTLNKYGPLLLMIILFVPVILFGFSIVSPLINAGTNILFTIFEIPIKEPF